MEFETSIERRGEIIDLVVSGDYVPEFDAHDVPHIIAFEVRSVVDGNGDSIALTGPEKSQMNATAMEELVGLESLNEPFFEDPFKEICRNED